MMGLRRCDDTHIPTPSPEDSQEEEAKSSSSSESSGDEGGGKTKEADEESEDEDPFEKRQSTFQQAEIIRQTQKMVNKGTIVGNT